MARKRKIKKSVEEVKPLVTESPVIRDIGRPKKPLPKIKKSPPPLKKN